jgi:hypothetical protein
MSLMLLFFPGRVAEQMGDLEHAITAYENALRHNPMSLSGLTQVAGIARIKENYPKVGKILDAISCQSRVEADVLRGYPFGSLSITFSFAPILISDLISNLRSPHVADADVIIFLF